MLTVNQWETLRVILWSFAAGLALGNIIGACATAAYLKRGKE